MNRYLVLALTFLMLLPPTAVLAQDDFGGQQVETRKQKKERKKKQKVQKNQIVEMPPAPPKPSAELLALQKELADFRLMVADYNRAEDYFYGRNGLTKNGEQALFLYRSAAEKGYLEAQNRLGSLLVYPEGSDIPKDVAEGLKWSRLAAEQGSAASQVRVGNIYADGLGVEKNLAEAVKWYRMAADQGLPVAQYLMGVMCEHGYGMPEASKQEAILWYQKALDQGYAPAEKAIKKLKK